MGPCISYRFFTQKFEGVAAGSGAWNVRVMSCQGITAAGTAEKDGTFNDFEFFIEIQRFFETFKNIREWLVVWLPFFYFPIYWE